jgi:hypothetical protein
MQNVTDKMQLENGSDHTVVASYSELYEEGEVEHTNSVWPAFLLKQLSLVASM